MPLLPRIRVLTEQGLPLPRAPGLARRVRALPAASAQLGADRIQRLLGKPQSSDDTREITPQPRDNAWAEAHDLAARFVVMHSGNVGHAQDLDTLVRAATFLRDRVDFGIVVAGFGARHNEMVSLAERLEDARELVDEARRRGVELLVNHRRRFDPLLYPLRDELREGLVGRLQQVSSSYVYGLVTTGTHLVDALRFLFGGLEGEVVWAVGLRNERPHFAPPDDPCIDGLLGFESGVKASVQGAIPLVSWLPAPEPDVKRYQVMRSAGGPAQLLATTTATSFSDPCRDPMPCPAGATLAYQVVAVRNSNHFGTAAYWTRRMAEALSKATGRQVELRVVVDPTVVGGVVAKVGDEIFDGSLRSWLTEARVHLSG